MKRSSRHDAHCPGRVLPALLGLLVARSLAGCGGGCPVLESCDIRRADCQAHTAEVATCLSGDPTVRPAVTVVDAQSYVEEQIASNTSAETPDEADQRRALALLNLMPAETDNAQLERAYWNTVGAFYDSETGSVTILDRGQPLDGASAVSTLLHEMIHALQYSREPGMAAQSSNDDDAFMAASGIVEGEAELYQDLASARGYGIDPGQVEWESIFSEYQARSWSRVIDSEAAYLMAWRYFPYAFGGQYVRDTWSQGDNLAVRDLFVQPPSSTRQILAGYGALPPDALPPNGMSAGTLSGVWREDLDALGSPILPAQYERVSSSHFGAWLFEIFRSRRLRYQPIAPVPVDSPLLGDVLSIFREPATGDVSVFWRLRLADTAAAAELVDELEALLATPELGHARYDRDVVIGASTRGPLASDFVRSLRWEAVPGPNPEAGEVMAPAAAIARAARFTCPLPP